MNIIKQIAYSLTRQRNGWQFTKVVENNGRKFRVDIYRDAYDFQSHAKVEMWNGQWIFVHEIPITECYCNDISYVSDSSAIIKGCSIAQLFDMDFDKLLEIARSIVLNETSN